jgi:hypothetical protein
LSVSGDENLSESAADTLGQAWLDGVPWWRRGLAVAAMVISVLAMTWSIRQGPGGGLGAIPTFLAAIPVFATARSFGKVARSFSLVLAVLGVLGVLLSFFLYLPAAVVLILAWLSDPGIRPRAAVALAGLGYAIAMIMTVVWTIALYHSP